MAKTDSSEFQHIVAQNPLLGLWRMLRGFRLRYAVAIGSLMVSVAARTGTYFLIGYLVNELVAKQDFLSILPLIAGGFVVLALTEGGFSFLSGRFAARTAEGIAQKVRNYL